MNSSVRFLDIVEHGGVAFRTDARRYQFTSHPSNGFVHNPQNVGLELPEYAIAGRLEITTPGYRQVAALAIVAYGSIELIPGERSLNPESLFEGWLLTGMSLAFAKIEDDVESKLITTPRIQSIATQTSTQ